MSWGKRLLKAPRTQMVLAWLLSLYIRLVFATNRLMRHVDAASETYLRGEQNAIFAFWHGRMMLLPVFCPPKRRMRVLISLHRDGLLISQVIGHFGQETVSGSSSKGGHAAALEIVRALEAGDNISITPDGPRGPSQVAAGSIAGVARMSGRPVLPVTFSSTRAKRFASWDRFMLALPFGRIIFCVGAPIAIPPDMDDETARLEIERAMNALVEKADGLAHA